MRKPIIAANWKMHKNIEEALSFAAEFAVKAVAREKVDTVICPPFTALYSVRGALRDSGIKLGAQNMYPESQGAFTGEISPLMLKNLDCEYVILGHSERRQLLGETDEFINLKIKAALEYGLKPILCVGETLEQRQKGQTEEICRNQLIGCLAGINSADLVDLVVAYEPIWAIGTGVNASAEDAEATCKVLRQTLAEQWGQETADLLRIQYGGSVKVDNIEQFIVQENIDGALVGGASLEVASFMRLVQIAGEMGQ